MKRLETLIAAARLDEAAGGLDQDTGVDAQHWGGHCVWKPPFCDRRRFGGLVPALDAALAGSPRDARLLARRGRALRLLGDLDAARADLEASLRVDERDAYARGAYADVLRAARRPEWPEEFERAVAAEPRLPWPRLWKAAWLLSDGFASKAAVELEAVRGRGGALEGILSGFLETSRRRFADARGHFARAAAADPRCPGAWIMVGKSERALGRVDRAAQAFEKAIRIDHDCKVAYYSFLDCGDPPGDLQGLARLDAALGNAPRPWGRALRGELLRMPGLARYAEAVAELEKAAAGSPRSAWIAAFLARAYGNVGRGREAAAEMDRAIALDPGCAWLRAWRGEARRKAGRTKEALADFARAVSLDDRYVYSFAWRGVALSELGRDPAALRDLDRALDLDPWYHLAYAERARVRLRLGDESGGAEDMTQAVRLNEKYGWVQEASGEARGGGRMLSALDRAVRRRPDLPALRAWRGETRLRLGDWPGAAEDCDAALARDPELGWAYAWRGEARVRLGRPSQALPDLEEGARREPRYARARAWLGAALLGLKRPREAAAALDAAIALDPKSAWSFEWRGRARLALADFSGAREDFVRATTLDRGYAAAWLGRAEASRGLERWEEAAADAGRALELDPRLTQACLVRALAYEKLGRYFEELLDFARAQRLSPELFPEAAREDLRRRLLAPAEEMLAQGRREQAQESLRKVLEADPGRSDARALLAKCRVRRKKADAAS